MGARSPRFTRMTFQPFCPPTTMYRPTVALPCNSQRQGYRCPDPQLTLWGSTRDFIVQASPFQCKLAAIHSRRGSGLSALRTGCSLSIALHPTSPWVQLCSVSGLLHGPDEDSHLADPARFRAHYWPRFSGRSLPATIPGSPERDPGLRFHRPLRGRFPATT